LFVEFVRRVSTKGTDSVVERTVAGLGYELVETQFALGGRLLRVFIDRPAESSAPPASGLVQSGISVGDC
jgi:ribosome maturation factor RimP